ncbi:MAG: hypothetical protein ACO27R_01220, partial [Hylemonella sp.]
MNLCPGKCQPTGALAARVNPAHLWPRRRSTYFFMMGSLAMEHNMNEADRLLREAIWLGLKQST